MSARVKIKTVDRIVLSLLILSPLKMAFRKLFSRLGLTRNGDTETQSTDPTVSPRPQTLQLGTRSSQSTAPPLHRQGSEGKQRRWSIRFESALTVLFGRNRWNGVTDSIRFRPSLPRPQCRRERIWESLEPCRRSHIRCLYSSQVCGRRPLGRPEILRCAISLFYKTLTPLTFNQQTMANRKIIESLIPRVEGLAQSLSSPAPEGEIEEIERRKILRR